MVGVTFISHDGTSRTLDIAPGQTLMEGAKAEDVPGIEAVCGGNCYCGTCRVRIAPEWLGRVGSPSSYEIDLIAATEDTDPATRLSCQITLDPTHDGLVVSTPEFQQ
jgi:2Fe-2S ferredoxin